MQQNMITLNDSRLNQAFLYNKHSFDEEKFRFIRSQYNDVLMEFFQSIDLMIANGDIDNYQSPFKDKYWEEELTPFDYAVKDAIQFTDNLYREVRGGSIPDINLCFGTNWYWQRQNKVDSGKVDSKIQKEAARFRLITQTGSEDNPIQSKYLTSDFGRFTEEEKSLIRYERTVIWKHIKIGEILSKGEPVKHYEQFYFDIARYQLEDLAKTYTKQSSLKSDLFLRLLLDALMFADCLNYLRADFNLPSNERLSKSEVRARLFNSGWISWFFFFVLLLVIVASFLFFDSKWVGAAVLAYIIYGRIKNRKKNALRLESYVQILRPYNLLEGGDEYMGYIDKGVIRKAMEEADVKYQVFTPISYKLIDSLSN